MEVIRKSSIYWHYCFKKKKKRDNGTGTTLTGTGTSQTKTGSSLLVQVPHLLVLVPHLLVPVPPYVNGPF